MIKEFIRLSRITLHHPEKFFKAIIVLFSQGPKAVKKKLIRQDILADYNAFINSQYLKWFHKNFPSNQLIKQQKEISKKFKFKPKISIITPVFNTPEKFLKECIDSVLKQSYPNWELCMADDHSSNPEIKLIIGEYAKKDKRIKYTIRPKNGHISEASNSALSISSGDFIAILDHDDVLWPDALFECVKVLNKNPEASFIYSDEDKLDEDGKTHLDPFFKPDWSPDYLRSINYITHFTVIKKTLVQKVGGFRKKFDGAQDWDLFLRITKDFKNSDIIHIPKVLYSWRKSIYSSASEKSVSGKKSYAFKIQKSVLEDDLKTKGYQGRIIRSQYLGLWRVKYGIKNNPLVSIIIPTKEEYDHIKKCIDSILNKTTYKNFQLIIVDTGSKDKKVYDFYEDIKTRHQNIKLLSWGKEFNFSSVCNFGAKNCNGKYLLFLNNDTEIINPDWLENMLEHAGRKEIGAVGVKLLFPNRRIQHAGIVLGIAGGMVRRGIAGHPFKNFYNLRVNNGYSKIVDSVRNCSAVTAACLMISKDKFKMVGGFDPVFRVAFNDVDFCLRVLEKGLMNIYTPYAILYHHESVSVGLPGKGDRSKKEFLKEVRLMHQRWDKILYSDPFYNPNFTLENEEYTLKI